MTRIACLLGSPRPGGNSDLLAGRLCETAESHGAASRCHALRDLRFQGYSETDSDPYGPDDDLAPVLADVKEADVVVMATPIYFCNMTGLLKQAFDRFFGFFKPDYVTNPEPSILNRGKTLVLVQVQGEGAERYDDLLGHYGPALDKLGFARRELIRSCGVRAPGDVLNDKAALERADTLAAGLARAQGG
jgi:multimeric flavodoxin WrbA